MDIKSRTIDFHPPITNQVLEVILTNQYINMYGYGIVYTIGDKMDTREMQQKLMGQTNN